MNGGLFPGLQLNGEQLGANSVGMEVVTASGSYVTKADNFEITLIGAGASGGSQTSGGDAGANLIKRVIGLPPGTSLTVVIGATGATGGASTCIIPGIGTLTANGAAGAGGTTGATATGGDINITGQTGSGLDQNGSGGVGGSTLLGFGGNNSAGRGQNGSGFGTGGGAGLLTGNQGGNGTQGVMVVRYF